MSDFLTNHAVKNVWCSPRQDLQVIYQPQRISNPRGVRGSISHMWESFPMPTPTDVYHVYQIGQYQAFLVGLSPVRNVWRSIASLMHDEMLMAHLHTVNGIQLCRFNSYVLVTQNQNVLVAVRDQARVADLRTEEVFLHLYSNSYFDSPRSDGQAHEIFCRGERVLTQQAALNFQNHYHNYRARAYGHTWLTVNGVYRSDYTPADYAMGDFLEFAYDSSVKAVKEFTIGALDTFDSILDEKRKYLLHYAGPQVDGVGIDYRDDIDVYLVRPGTGSRFTGTYFHKNNDDAFRQVTHRDYAANVDYVAAHQQAMLTRLGTWTDLSVLKLRLFIRHSGYRRPLVFEHHRIQELYKLPEQDLYQAMIGVDSTVPVWRVDNLENSEYIKVMDAGKAEISNDLVKTAYGYNAIAKLIGDTPNRVEVVSGRRMVPLPFGTQVDSTAFEINALGKLISTYVHTSGAEYTPFNSTCTMVEMISGRGGSKLDMNYGVQDHLLNPLFSYRFYVAPIAHGELQNDQWEDVTGDETKYEIINNRVHWYVDRTLNSVCVKSDAYFLNYELSMPMSNGLLRFSVNATANFNGTQSSGVMYIPPGRLDLWLNDECLIEGLDYFVKWPQVVITNKKFLIPNQNQRIRIRGTGFCASDMKLQAPKEVGFVRWGKLSRNNRYDLRDDRVIRLVVGGRTYHRSDVRFTEGDPSLWMQNVPNGSPYTLEDLVVPLRRVVNQDTYFLRQWSLEVDEDVSDYLTLKMPEYVPQDPDPIPDRYAIYSPFAASLLYDLITERLSTEGFRGHYSDQDVRNYLSDYEWLLDYDPTRKDVDLAHVAIHPHERNTVVEVDAYQYMLLNRAIKVFLEDKVDITSFVRIKDSFI